MPDWHHIVGALAGALTPDNLLFALGGVVVGTIVGSLPGLTATMAIAVLIPLTFTLPTASALILMGAIYTGAIYGGAYAAILLNTPGTPSAIGTVFDGYPMAKAGNGDLAITLACLASVFGGLVGAAALLLLAPPLAQVALAFGPVEYFWLAIFGLSLIAALSSKNLLKGLIGGALGLLLSTIGVAEISADVRFTFGARPLLGGIEIVSALIGLYCIPVLLDLVASPIRHLPQTADMKSGLRLREAISLSLRHKFNLIRSAVIGTLVGILPGAGGSIAGLVAYSEARRAAENQDRFGKGEPQGIQATEAANNATVGGGFIPTLVLGIPGTPPDAVILGALLVQGVRVGPELFTAQGGAIYTFIWGLFIATLLMLPAGLFIGRYAFRFIASVPREFLVAAVAFMTIIGSFAIRNNLADVGIMIVLGGLAWVLGLFGFSASPIVLGLILGSIAEQGFVQAWTIGAAVDNLGGMFFGRGISLAIIAMILLSLLYPLIAKYSPLRRWVEPKVEPVRPKIANATIPAEQNNGGGTAVAMILLLSGGIFWFETYSMTDADSFVFPRAVIVALAGFCLILTGRNFLYYKRGIVTLPTVIGSWRRRLFLIAVMLAAVAAIPIVGFVITMVLAFLALAAAAYFGDYKMRGIIIYMLLACLFIGGFYMVFSKFLHVPLPNGILIG